MAVRRLWLVDVTPSWTTGGMTRIQQSAKISDGMERGRPAMSHILCHCLLSGWGGFASLL